MQINFNTDEASPLEAMSLIALLIIRYTLKHADIFPDAMDVATISGSAPKTGKRSVPADIATMTNTAANQASNAVAALQPATAAEPAIAHADNPATGAPDAAEVFAAPVHVMLPPAGGTTYQAYRDAGWTDAQLIGAGMMAEPEQKVNAPLAQQPGATPAPSSTAQTTQPPSKDAASVFAATSATPAPPPASVPAPADTTGGVQIDSEGLPIPSALPNGGVQIDSEGLPWDGRIHASTRTKTAGGVWKKKKGVDAAEMATVANELRAAMAADKAAAHTPLNAPPPPPPPAATGATPPPPPPPPPAATGPVTFADVMKYVAERGFSAEQIQNTCMAYQVPGISLLQVMPNACAPVLAAFKAIP